MERHLANRWKHDQVFALSGLDAHGPGGEELIGRTLHRFGIQLCGDPPVKIWIHPPPGATLIPKRSVVLTDLIDLYFIRGEQEAPQDGGTAAAAGFAAGSTFGAGGSDTGAEEETRLVGPFDDQVPSEEIEWDLGLPAPEEAAAKAESLTSGAFRVVAADEQTVLMCTDEYLGRQATFHAASPAFGAAEIKAGATVLTAGAYTFSLHLERGLLRSTLTIARSRTQQPRWLTAAAEKCYDADAKARRRLRTVSPSPCPRHVPEFLQPAYHKALSLLRCCVRRPMGAMRTLWPVGLRDRDAVAVPEAVAAVLAWRFIDKQLAVELLAGLLEHVEEAGFLPMTLGPEPSADAPPAPPMLAFAAYHVGHQLATRSVIERLYGPVRRHVQWIGRHLASPVQDLLAWPTPAASLEPDSPRFENHGAIIPVDLNSLYVAELRYLAGMAKALGRLAEHHECVEEADRRSQRLRGQLYNGQEGFFFDQGGDGNLLHLKAAAGFLPMYAYAVQSPEAKRLVEHVTHVEQFRLAFPVPSLAADARDFAPAPDRGAVNPLLNYLVIRGMERYGYKTIADNFTNVTLAALAEAYDATGCFWPHYDPTRKHRPADLPTAPHHGPPTPDYAPTAAIFLSLCHEYYGPQE